MPGVETFGLVHRGVLWPVGGVDRRGQNALGRPIEVACRWRGTESKSAAPTENSSTSAVTADVDRQVAVGSVMWQGSYVEWVRAQRNAENALLEVVSYAASVDVKGRRTAHTVTLQPYKGALPDA